MIRTALLSAAIAAVLAAPAATWADPWKDESGHGRGKPERHQAHKHRGGPPPWAPAHGYRRKHRGHYYEDLELYARVARDIGITAGTCNREAVGAVLGGVVGGALGSQVGKGDGRKLATVAGAVIGVLVGRDIGRRMDEGDQACTGQVLERVADQDTVAWRNPDTGTEYRVTPTRTYEAGERFCREYRTEATVGGQRQTVYGTACRNPDGSWEMAPQT